MRCIASLSCLYFEESLDFQSHSKITVYWLSKLKNDEEKRVWETCGFPCVFWNELWSKVFGLRLVWSHEELFVPLREETSRLPHLEMLAAHKLGSQPISEVKKDIESMISEDSKRGLSIYTIGIKRDNPTKLSFFNRLIRRYKLWKEYILGKYLRYL